MKKTTPPASRLPPPALDTDLLSLLGSLPAGVTEVVQQILRERDHLFVLHEALVEVGRAKTLEQRLRIFVDAIRKIGFGRVVVSLRDAELDPTLIIAAGLSEDEERRLRDSPVPGAIWRRRLPELERFRISQSFYLVAADPWVAGEFRDSIPSSLTPADDPNWSPRDTLIVPLRGVDGAIIALVVLDDPVDRRRPSLARIRSVELFAQQMAHVIEQTRLGDLTGRRTDRLQMLHDVGSALARSLDERELIHELARQVSRILPAEGVVIARPVEDGEMIETLLRIVRGKERPRSPHPIGRGAIAEVVRTGRSVRVDDWESARTPIVTGDDVVGDGGPAGSLLAVPIRIGQDLMGVLAVYSARRGAYGAEEEEILVSIGAQAAAALINARHFGQSQRERRQSEALGEVARAVGGSLRLSEVLDLTLRHAVALTRATGASVALCVPETEELHCVAAIGSATPLADQRIPMNASVSGRVVREGRAAITNDAGSDAEAWRPSVERAAIRKIVLVPLKTRNEAIGVLSVQNRAIDFDDADVRILQRLADHVAVAIVNARLFSAVERHRRVVETSSDAIVITDLDRRIAFVNPAAERLFGYTGSVIGMPVAKLVPPDFDRVVRDHEDAALSGEPQRYDAVLLRADGTRRAVAISTAPLYDMDRITGIVASLRDVTEEKRLTEQLLQQEKLAAIGQLVSGVAHELNNPLAGVMAFAQLLQSSMTPGTEEATAVETIQQETRRAAKIVSNLLTFARQHHPQRSVADLNQVVLDTIELRRYALRMNQIELEIDLDQGLPPTWGDSFQLQQVILNLLTNAEHAVMDREGDRRVRVSTRSGMFGHLEIAVADNGVGISADDVDRIFNPFFTTKPVGQGTGLGLSISDGIVRQHGGRIRVEATPGGGATLVIEIPLTNPPDGRSAAPAPAPPPRRAQPRRILLIDDERSIRTGVSTYLTSGGHTVTAVGTAAEALDALDRSRFDAILLDLRLPDMPGEQLYERIRLRFPDHAGRVIFLSGDVSGDRRREFVETSGRPHLAKPFQLEELGLALQSIST